MSSSVLPTSLVDVKLQRALSTPSDEADIAPLCRLKDVLWGSHSDEVVDREFIYSHISAQKIGNAQSIIQKPEIQKPFLK